MRAFSFLLFICLSQIQAIAQSNTTEALADRFEGELSLYFYKNTLRMLNQTEDQQFDELIKDIEKLKFMLIDKSGGAFTKADYKRLLTGYRNEAYEEMMTGRFDGRNFDVYLKEKNGKTLGMVILANDSSNLYVLDMLGRVELTKVPELFKTLDESSDITKKIRAFTDGNDRRKGKGDDEDN